MNNTIVHFNKSIVINPLMLYYIFIHVFLQQRTVTAKTLILLYVKFKAHDNFTPYEMLNNEVVTQSVKTFLNIFPFFYL